MNAKKAKELQIAKNAKTNPKALFKYISTKTKPKEGITNLTKKDSTLTENDSEKSNVLNDFFSSVFVEEGDGPVPEFTTDFNNVLSDLIITDEDMLKVLSKLNSSKSPGPDAIHPRILKELQEQLSHPLKLLFMKTIKDGKLPDSWKEAEVIPIFKNKGRKDSPSNYRPVSLTSIICKIFEHFVRDALYTHLIENCLLSKDQFGFCKARSCVSQLLVTINEWFNCIDKKIPVDAAYLDFRKAFDSVPHKRLISKLYGYGVRGKVLNWISDFLSERTQYVNVNNNPSCKVPVTSGVPQGSVLGPCLFIYYINDLPDATKCLIKIFADDTKAYLPVQSNDDHDMLQYSINKLVEWTDKWLLKFNSDKCNILYLGKNNPKHKYFIKEGDTISELSETTCEKDLGVFIDPLLSFNFHVSSTIKKARRMSGLIIRNISCKSPAIMVPLFKALVRPILEYANVVWCPFNKNHILQLEKVQQQFTKRINGMYNMSYPDRLYKLKLPSLEYRRLRGDYIETYKILNDIYDPLTTHSLLTLETNKRTRSNGFKLKKIRTKRKPYGKFFTNRTVNRWNRLPKQIASADSINTFKNKLDVHLSDIVYSTKIVSY